MANSARKLIARREYFSLLPLLPVLKYLGSVLQKFSVVLQVLCFLYKLPYMYDGSSFSALYKEREEIRQLSEKIMFGNKLEEIMY